MSRDRTIDLAVCSSSGTIRAGPLRIDAGRCNTRLSLVGAHRLDLAVLEEPQQQRLHAQAHLADLVEKDLRDARHTAGGTVFVHWTMDLGVSGVPATFSTPARETFAATFSVALQKAQYPGWTVTCPSAGQTWFSFSLKGLLKMKSLRHFTAATMLLAASATMASAQGNNDSVDYAPGAHTVAGTLPVNTQYTLAVSAPTQLNKKGEEALAGGITATIRVNVASYPEGSSPAEAQALVSVDDSSLTFFALGETHQTTVRVAASANTTPGDYVYTIQAVGPEGLGWGNSGHTLTVTLSRPVVTDNTPPDVTITSPTAGQAFTFCTGGTTIPVTISAVDAESFVFAVGFTVNGAAFGVNPFTAANTVSAQGQFVAPTVGAYELGAWATSAGGTGQSPKVGVSVNYAMSWLPPLSLGRTINGAVAIKFAARDCQGKFVADSSVRVEVWEAGVQRFAAVYGDGSDAVRINETDEHYIANFHPPAGNHSYTVKVFFNGFQQASTNFNSR